MILSLDSQKEDQSSVLEQLVSDTKFDGFIVLDMREDSHASNLTPTDWDRLIPGVHSNLLICDSIIELRSCRIYRNNLIESTLIKSKAVIISCSLISVSENDFNTYGELIISVGAESGGGRKLHLTAQHTMVDVCKMLRRPQNARQTRTQNCRNPRRSMVQYCRASNLSVQPVSPGQKRGGLGFVEGIS